jgi:hypothetical protein
VLCRALCVLLFVAWTAEWPLEADPHLYCGYWRSPFAALGPLFVSVPGIGLSPWQLVVMALAPLCLLRPGAFRGRAHALDAAIAVSLASVAATFVWGWMRGGSPYHAYYQLWRFLVALLVALLLHSVVRRPADIRAVGATVLAAALVRACLAIYFYRSIVLGRIDPPPPYMTNHDDTLLFVAGLLVAVGWAAVRGSWGAWLLAFASVPVLVYAIVVNDRRLAWIELFLVAAVLCLLPMGRNGRRRRNAFLAAATPLFAAYVAVGVGRPEPVFGPVNAVVSASGNEDASSLARQEEVRNLLYTLSAARNPLLGTGWGVPYVKVTSVYANFDETLWWQYRYLPHNSLLALAVFGGLVGIAGIWLVVPVTAYLATRGFRLATGAPERAGALAALGLLPAYGVQCFGDLGFQSLTCGLLLAAAMAVGGKAAVLGSRRPAAPAVA